MFLKTRWLVLGLALPISAFVTNRLWPSVLSEWIYDQLLIPLTLFCVVVLVLYLVLGALNDGLIALLGRKHVEAEAMKILTKWLDEERTEFEYLTENILQEKALRAIRRVPGLKRALTGHFGRIKAARESLSSQVGKANLESAQYVSANTALNRELAKLHADLLDLERKPAKEIEEVRSRSWEIQESKPIVTLETESVGVQPDAVAVIPPWGIATPDLLNATWTLSVQREGKQEIRRDPIYGVIALDEKLSQIFAQPIVQRLNHIRQLSFSYLTFPSATHTRLAHSLGVCRNAERALSGMLERGSMYSSAGLSKIDISGEERDRLLLKCRVAALLHDLGHGPFGHALDKYVGFLEGDHPRTSPDKDYSIRYIREHLATGLQTIGLDPESVVSLLDKTERRSLSGFDVLVSDIIDSPFGLSHARWPHDRPLHGTGRF